VSDTQSRVAYSVAIAGGALLWLLTMALSGRTAILALPPIGAATLATRIRVRRRQA
jgi:hypothetical protein